MPMASMWVAIITEGRGDLSALLRLFFSVPRFSPWTEPRLLWETSSTSGVHCFLMRSAAGVSSPERPETEIRDFRNGRMSLMDHRMRLGML